MIKQLFSRKSIVAQVILLFFLFHLFWVLFYYLSRTVFFIQGNFDLLLKYFCINTIGFVAFLLSAFLLFPLLIKKKFYVSLTVLVAIILSLGFFKFEVQDWNIHIFTAPVIPKNEHSFAAVPMKQPIGAPVRAMLEIFVYVLLGLGYAYMKDWFIKDRKTKILEKEKLQAELTLLRYQLNPHFLFNTINDIYYLAIIKSDKTADAILKVSELLRYVLNEKNDFVNLEKEIETLKEFIKLQQFRFPDQVIDMHFEMIDDISHYEIAPMLLITFAENAFKHGDPGTEERPLKIELLVQNKVIEYTVTNSLNGNNHKDETTGIGLKNLEKRLSLLYPDRHFLTLDNEGNLFRAKLKILL